MHLLSAYINTALISLASSSLTIRKDMTTYYMTNISALEKKVNNIFQVTHESISSFLITLSNLKAILATTTYRLSKQRKNDFRLKEDDLALTNLQTEVSPILFGLIE
jgi:exocyst complex component 5